MTGASMNCGSFFGGGKLLLEALDFGLKRFDARKQLLNDILRWLPHVGSISRHRNFWRKIVRVAIAREQIDVNGYKTRSREGKSR